MSSIERTLVALFVRSSLPFVLSRSICNVLPRSTMPGDGGLRGRTTFIVGIVDIGVVALACLGEDVDPRGD
jgi:hypothetical protein